MNEFINYLNHTIGLKKLMISSVGIVLQDVVIIRYAVCGAESWGIGTVVEDFHA